MEIKLKKVIIGEVSSGYKDDTTTDKNNTAPDTDAPDGQVVGYDGKLNIRPLIQREFIYGKDDSIMVMNSIIKRFPLNAMYWVKNEGDTYEVLDGQQRTISFCQYIRGDFGIDIHGHVKYFDTLEPEEQKQILDYELQIYVCEGNDQEMMDWFRIVNKQGKKLTEQELKNINYTGTWLTSAKRYCSKPHCRAYEIGHPYINGRVIRQEYLEVAIEWISNGEIEDYMAKHRHDLNANELISNFEEVVAWTKKTFPNPREQMKGARFGLLYNRFKDREFSVDEISELENEITELMKNINIQKKSGIYEYVLTRDKQCLYLRDFTPKQKLLAYDNQKGICPICDKHYEFKEMEGDHIISWINGGTTEDDNCQMLCKYCNRTKAGK